MTLFNNIDFSVFLRFTKVRRGSAILEYASIAERTMVDNKQKTTTVKYLGPVKSNEDRERYQRTFEEYFVKKAL